jgi:hypothetical protein
MNEKQEAIQTDAFTFNYQVTINNFFFFFTKFLSHFAFTNKINKQTSKQIAKQNKKPYHVKLTVNAYIVIFSHLNQLH